MSGTSTTKLELGARPRILVITLRRLGDVLLTTPLIRSIKRAWPDCEIDVLAYAATGGILSGNPDIARVIGIPEPPNVLQDIALMARLRARSVPAYLVLGTATWLATYESGVHPALVGVAIVVEEAREREVDRPPVTVGE